MDNLTHPLGNHSTTSGTFVAGTTSTLTTSTTINYSIKGVLYIKTAMTAVASPTTDIVRGTAFRPISANQGTVVVVGLDAGGNVVAAQGTIEALDTAGAFINAPQLPSHLGALYAPFGAIILKGGATLVGTWTFGTNNLSAVTGMTYTFKNLATIPPRPIVS